MGAQYASMIPVACNSSNLVAICRGFPPRAITWSCVRSFSLNAPRILRHISSFLRSINAFSLIISNRFFNYFTMYLKNLPMRNGPIRSAIVPSV